MGLPVMPRLRKAVRTDFAPFNVSCLIFFLSPFAAGLYRPWQWGGIAVLYGILLIWQLVRQQNFQLTVSWGGAVTAVTVSVSAIANLLWGIDRGGTVDGLLRVLAAILFYLLILQWTPLQRKKLVELLPWMGTCMVVLCLIGGLFPAGRVVLYENGRMSGTFAYANTFGLFLLLCIVIVQMRQPGLRENIMQLLMLIGIVASGSRGTLCLLGGWIIYRLCVVPNRNKQLIWIILLAVVIASVGAVLLDGWIFKRFFTGNVFSTLWGRLLYAKDALRLLLKHPLGVGYLGWFYLQRMVQTGVYNVRFVHNELLQFALDYGIPAAMVGIGWVIWRIRKSACCAPAAILICLHSLFDPDLQFGCIVIILLLLISPASVSDEKIKCCKHRIIMSIVSVLTAFFLVRGTADAAFCLGYQEVAACLVPLDIEIATQQMLSQKSLQAAAKDAYRILQNNQHVSIAWQILAEHAMSMGDYQTMSSAQRQAVILWKYDLDVYTDAWDRLEYALADDWEAEKVITEMEWLLNEADQVYTSTDPLGWKINDLPQRPFSVEERMAVRVFQQMLDS